MTFSPKSGTLNSNRIIPYFYVSNKIFRTRETVVKDKSLLGFIVIDLLLALGVIWGLYNGYKLLGYGLLVYFVINTLALVLKLNGSKKNGDGGNDK